MSKKIVLSREVAEALDKALEIYAKDRVLYLVAAGSRTDAPFEFIRKNTSPMQLAEALVNGYHTAEDKWKDEYRISTHGVSRDALTARRILLEIAQDFNLDIIPEEDA